METQNIQIQEQQKQMRKLLFEKQELSNADLILIENRKLRNQINLSNQKATDQVFKANVAIKQAEEKEKNLNQIIVERVRSKVSKEIEKKERALDKKRATFQKDIKIFSWVAVAVFIFLALVIWGAYDQKQEARKMLNEGKGRIAIAKKMESKAISNGFRQTASSSDSTNSSEESSTPTKSYEIS